MGMPAVAASQQKRSEPVFVESINDSTEVEVHLRYDANNQPTHYFTHVNTAVCEEGLCKLLVVDVYWDLLGNFLRYELPEGEELTKLDHKEFTPEDHEKLNKILADRSSILKDYPLEDLIVRPARTSSGKVDAVSAATRVDAKDAIVGGAVYSTYVLWHIVNGPIASRISDVSRRYLTEERVARMFYSDNFYYQYHALSTLKPADSLKHIDGVVHLVAKGKDYIPLFAVERVPSFAWKESKYQIRLLEAFQNADFELRNAMLDRLSRIVLSPQAIDLLAGSLDEVTDKQANRIVKLLAANRTNLTPRATEALDALARKDGAAGAEAKSLVRELSKDKRKNR